MSFNRKLLGSLLFAGSLMASAASAQTEIKLGHVGEPGSLFARSSEEFARHDRHAEATRRAVRAWGLEILCAEPAEYSSSLTAVLVPEGHDADHLRRVILERFDMSLGTGLAKLAGKVFRIGHLGDFNDLSLAGTLAGVEMGLTIAGIPHRSGGLDAALRYLEGESRGSAASQTKAAE